MVTGDVMGLDTNVSLVVEFLKMVGPKKQDFRPRIDILKGFFFKSVNELGFIKNCQNRTFKVIFQCQKSTDLKKKWL